MSSIRRIPSDTARRQHNRRFTMDFRMLLDDEPDDISGWDDVRIDVLDTNGVLVKTWTVDNYLTRPANDRLLIDVTLPTGVEIPALTNNTQTAQYLLDLYKVTNKGPESFASMTLYLDRKPTVDYQAAKANSDVIFVKRSTLAPGTTLEGSSELSTRMTSIEDQVASVVGGQALFTTALNFPALAAMSTPVANTYVTVKEVHSTDTTTYLPGLYILQTDNKIIFCLTGEEIARP